MEQSESHFEKIFQMSTIAFKYIKNYFENDFTQ